MDNYYSEIKELLINNEITKRVKDYSKNRSDLETYYNVGKMLSEAGKHYGEGIIKKYSIKLINELDKKYSERMLRKYRQFYNYCSSTKIWPTMSAKLTWSHIMELLSLNDTNIIYYYSNKVIKENLTIRQLRERIKSKEYERLPDDTKNKLVNNSELNIKELIPEPIIIKNNSNLKEIISEKTLKQYIKIRQ